MRFVKIPLHPRLGRILSCPIEPEYIEMIPKGLPRMKPRRSLVHRMGGGSELLPNPQKYQREAYGAGMGSWRSILLDDSPPLHRFVEALGACFVVMGVFAGAHHLWPKLSITRTEMLAQSRVLIYVCAGSNLAMGVAIRLDPK